jgi:hypothetical protein
MFDDPGFPPAPLNHEWRRAVRMDEVAAEFGQHCDLRFVGRHHGRELVFGAAADVEKERDEPNAFRQQPDDLLGHAGPQRRVDHSYDAAPAGECHAIFPPR